MSGLEVNDASVPIRSCNLSVECLLFEERCHFNHCGFSSSSSQTCQVGLNFASEEEAKRFRAAINDLLNRRQRKTGKFYGSLCLLSLLP